MNILSERTATLNYGKIKNIHNDTNHSSREKTPKLWPILEDIFIEMTSNDVAFGTPIIERMRILFDGKGVPKEIVDNTHKTRMLCNAIRHKGHEANEIDYVASVESIVKCMNYFSGVAIPLEVECIYNSRNSLDVNDDSEWMTDDNSCESSVKVIDVIELDAPTQWVLSVADK